MNVAAAPEPTTPTYDTPLAPLEAATLIVGFANAFTDEVPPGLYGDVSGDPNMRETDPEEGKTLTFFLYMEALAMKTALLRLGYGTREAERVFAGNARDLLRAVQRETYQTPGRWEQV